ncbi:hypothetical protein L6E12_27260 [Actinokineospora sp. PR83]|uniref:hypothetical protein n=1 Tax=Actinokineospora sp. PR83 TaxID=2884908 RepID=UPI001F454BF2|nr:hypothetical protein [Actinokineospora sp. PR83]MCG8919478.1 hypothetical protein [Actinokineospora sp. PR83]
MAAPKKVKGVFGIVGSVAAASSAVNGLKNARADNDKLALLNALAGGIAAITGVLIAVRALRSGK